MLSRDSEATRKQEERERKQRERREATGKGCSDDEGANGKSVKSSRCPCRT